MSYEGAERVALHVRRPFVLGCIGGPDTDVARLKGFELLLRAEFIGHDESLSDVRKTQGAVLNAVKCAQDV